MRVCASRCCILGCARVRYGRLHCNVLPCLEYSTIRHLLWSNSIPLNVYSSCKLRYDEVRCDARRCDSIWILVILHRKLTFCSYILQYVWFDNTYAATVQCVAQYCILGCTAMLRHAMRYRTMRCHLILQLLLLLLLRYFIWFHCLPSCRNYSWSTSAVRSLMLLIL